MADSDRHKQLKDLQDYLNNIEKDITFILQGLNWNWNEIVKHKSLVQCPINPHHRLPADKLPQHLEVCNLRSQGYQDTDQLLPESTVSETNAFSVKPRSRSEVSDIFKTSLTKDRQFKLVRCLVIDAVDTNNCVANISQDDRPIPQTIDRIQSTYTPDERRAIYDHVIEKTPKLEPPDDFTVYSAERDESKPKSEFESKAALRDLKRRRTKYKVSTKNKNHTEVLREVIKNQMEVYKEIIGHQTEDEATNKNCNDEVNRNQGKLREEDIRDSSRDTDSSYNIERKREIKDYERRSHKPDRSRDNRESYDKYHGKSNKRSRNEDDHYNNKDRGESSRSSYSSRHKYTDKESSDSVSKYEDKYRRDKSYKSSKSSSSKFEGHGLDDASQDRRRRRYY